MPRSTPNGQQRFLRTFDLDRHPSDTIDFDHSSFAVLHRSEPLVICATGKRLANLNGGDARGPGYNFANRMLQVVSVIILTKLLVHPKAHAKLCGSEISSRGYPRASSGGRYQTCR